MDAKAQREEKLRVAERAAEWLQTLEDSGVQERSAFAEWVSASPLHLKEFLLMSALDAQITRMDPQKKIVIEEILARAGKNNVVSLGGKEEPKARVRNTVWISSIAAALACITTAAWWMINAGGQTYQTAVGEQRRMELADGSIVQLGTGSRVRVEFSDTARELFLLDGEALFKVAREANRPFRVHSDTSVIQAIGTQFNVLRRPSGTTVSVLEGVVRVSAAQSAPLHDKTLTAGEEMRVDHGGRVQQRKSTELAVTHIWQRNRLVFRDDTLEDMAAEFNRYNSKAQIRLATEDIRNRRYTAVFDADDPQSLIEFLRQDSGLIVEQRADEILVGASPL